MALTQISSAAIKNAEVKREDIDGNAINEPLLDDNCITAAQIQAGVIAEVNLNIDNTPTNDYVLTAKSSAAGGLTWAAAASGVGGATGVDFNDDVKIRLGNGNDLELYHDSTYSNIKNSNANGLWISSDLIAFANAATSENLAKFIANGGVELYYDNVQKINTNASGVDIGLSSNACHLMLFDGGEARFGTGQDLSIKHDGTNSIILNSTGDLRIAASGSGSLLLQAKDGEHSIIANEDAEVKLYYDNVKKFETTSDGGKVTGNLTVTTGNSILTNSSQGQLTVKAGASYPGGGIKFAGGQSGTTDRGTTIFYNSGDTNLTESMRIDSSGRVGIGTTATDKNAHSFLNLHRDTSDALYMYFTNSTTGEAGSDGFTIGLDSDEKAMLWNRENTDIRFATNGTERMTLLAAGGLTFNGDSAAANALNDYETGTFTPTICANGSTTGQVNGTGSYVKIGKQVNVHINFGNKTLTSLPTGDIAVKGLPFTVNQGNGDEFGMSSKMVVMGVDNNAIHGFFRTQDNTTQALGYFNQDGSVWAQWSTTQWNNSGVYLIFNMTYFTNS